MTFSGKMTNTATQLCGHLEHIRETRATALLDTAGGIARRLING